MSAPMHRIVLEAFARALRNVLACTQETERRGVVLCLGNIGRTTQTDGCKLAEIGEVNPDKRNRYYRFAREKVVRLDQHPDHFTSGESANEAAEQYAGAVRAPELLGSVSGLARGLDDEAVVLLAFVELELLTPEGACEIGQRTNNVTFLKIVGLA